MLSLILLAVLSAMLGIDFLSVAVIGQLGESMKLLPRLMVGAATVASPKGAMSLSVRR